MAIKYLNIKSGEVRVARTEPQISAMWASSDRSPNITQGQDFGWRLAPEVVAEMEDILSDQVMIQRIAAIQGRPMEDIGEKEVLAYISSKTTETQAPVATEGDYEDDYRDAVKKARQARKAQSEPAKTPEPTPPAAEEPQTGPATDEEFDTPPATTSAKSKGGK